MNASGGCMVSDGEKRQHTPVLVDAVLQALGPDDPAAVFTGCIVDATLGAGGHARAILAAFPLVELFGIDRDPEALELAREELADFADRVTIAQGRVSELEELLERAGIRRVVGMLMDLGSSSMQLDRPERGFSFQADGPLDMRMDPRLKRTAADIVNRWDERDLADLIYHEGGERRSRRIAKAIVAARRNVPFTRTLPLADTVANAVGGRTGKTHPATKTFLALRRAVNEEAEELARGLLLAQAELVPGGKLAVITFQSGEDGQVKRFLQQGAKEGRWKLLTKKPVEPERSEVRANPRARSARLRAATRLNGLRARGGRPRGGRV